jgi:5-enolpyruvylshikimate-3-phosphate synthase
MVFAGVLLGLVEPRVRVRGFEAAAKSWPRLLQDLEALGLEWIPGPTQHSY